MQMGDGGWVFTHPTVLSEHDSGQKISDLLFYIDEWQGGLVRERRTTTFLYLHWLLVSSRFISCATDGMEVDMVNHLCLQALPWDWDFDQKSNSSFTGRVVVLHGIKKNPWKVQQNVQLLICTVRDIPTMLEFNGGEVLKEERMSWREMSER